MKFAAVSTMRVMSATIMIAPITTGPTGSWNGTVDRFAIILPRQMNVYVAYKLSSTDAVSIVSAMRPRDVPVTAPPEEMLGFEAMASKYAEMAVFARSSSASTGAAPTSPFSGKDTETL